MPAMFTLALVSYRFYNDTDLASPDPIADQNTIASTLVAAGETVKHHIRVLLDESGGVAGASTDDYVLQSNSSQTGGGAWTSLTITSARVRAFDSAHVTEGQTFTGNLTGGSGTLGTKASEDGEVNDIAVASGGKLELLFTFELIGDDLVDGETQQFRVLRNGGTVTSTVTPQINVTKVITATMAASESGSDIFAGSGTSGGGGGGGGSGDITFVGSAGGGIAAAGSTIAFSTLRNEADEAPTILEGDVVYVSINLRGTSDSQFGLVTTGYEPVYPNVYVDGTNDANLITYAKRMGATPDTQVEFAAPGFGSISTYDIHVLRGVDPTTPLDGVTPTTSGSVGIASPDAPAITPASAGAWIVAVGGAVGSTTAGSVTTITRPANMSSAVNHHNGGLVTRSAIGVSLKTDWASGAFDPDTFGGGSTEAAGTVAAATFVVRPEAGDGGITGTLAATETGADTLAATGTVAVGGSLAAQETGVDIFAAGGVVAISGTLAVQEAGSDTFSASGGVGVSGSLAAQEAGADTLAASGTVTDPGLVGAMAVQESGPDVLAASGTVAISGTLGAVETGPDVFTGSGTVEFDAVTGALAAQESGSDTFDGSGAVAIDGDLAAQETGSDSLNATGAVAVSCSLAATETGSDTFAASGTVESGVTGALSATETWSDNLSATGQIAVSGDLAASESGSDAATFSGMVLLQGILAAVETGQDIFYAVTDPPPPPPPSRIAVVPPINTQARVPALASVQGVAAGGRVVKPPRRTGG